MNVYAASLGCPKNQVDTDRVIGGLLQEVPALCLVYDPSEADILLVNTCGFIQEAVEESIEVILELARDKRPGQKLVVIGCLVERYGGEFAKEVPEGDLFVGVRDPSETVKLIAGLQGREPPLASRPGGGRIVSTPPWRAYLKVADGCSNRCTYCLIPGIRGGYRSEPYGAVLQEARELASMGVKELTLVAQDLTAYDWKGKGLSELVSAIAQGSNIPWIRLLYLHPGRILESRILETMARNRAICRYLDIPIQHASNRILRLMGRGYTREQIDLLLEAARSRIPGVSLRTTVMVGFPGETEDDFEILKEGIERWRFDHLGCFVYSDEQEAASSRLHSKVPREEALRRKEELMALQAVISRERNAGRIGERCKVLVEGFSDEKGGVPVGRTEFQGPEIDGVVYIRQGEAPAGEFVEVEITHADTYDLAGKVVQYPADP